ncbi:hypothetical protein [Solirubrobacter deserti]|uniref:Uncharacterized protein n=1 Tax=Solirubrobacter deserti TaxID=2282478 RepID=A0ABT4RSR6_9ACTN|nr:hypothetical protein [Solirubrobacter deserti]MDA0141614.1 hypothetical protein [Solirubrobacter deserti]
MAPGGGPAGPGLEAPAGAAGVGDIAGLAASAGGAAAAPLSVLGAPGAIAGAMGGVAAAVTGGLNAAAPAAPAGPAAAPAGGTPDVGAEAAGGEGEGGAAKEGPSEEELAEIETQLAAGPQREEEPEPAPAPASTTFELPEPETADTAEPADPEAAEPDPGPEPAEDAAVSPAMAPDAPMDEAAPAAVAAPEVEAGPAPAEALAPTPEPTTEPEDAGGGETFIARAPATELLAPPTEDLTAEPEEEPAQDPSAISADAQGELEALGASGGGEYAGGGGGGGGGGAVEAEPEAPAPDVSNADPAAAVSTAASLKPAQMLETLGGAEKAAANHVTKEQEKLAAQPPEIEAGGGADGPAADEKHASTPPSRPTTTKAAAKSGGEPEKPAPTPAPPPKAPLPPGPALTPDPKGNVSEGDGAKIKAAIDALPTSDGAVAVPAISTPKLQLTGAADPAQMGEQKAHLDETVAKTSAQGVKEAAEPAGENDLAPTTKPEKIKAEIPAGGAQAAPGAAGPGADDETASIVADQESGPQLKAAASQAAAQIGAEKQQHAQKAAQTKAAAVEEAQAEEAKGKADQIAEHAAAKAGVSQARSDWTGEQKQLADAARTEATGAVGEAQTAIQTEKGKAEQEAVKHVEAGRKEAEDAKRKGDEEAKREKDKAKEESGGGGFFGWVASKAKALYDKVKDGITAVFNKVRSAITTAINKAKELAHSVIDRAVKFVADKVKAVAGKLLAIGDKLIPGFAAARQKFGKWIKDRVKQAVQALNRIVTAVKDGIRKVMTAVGNALKQGLDLLKKGISAAIDAVKNVVKAAIEKAKAAIAALGQFAAIIKDIASNPGQWLSNLGAAVMDGIKNHLWKALKTAIQSWFNEKLESLLGLGKSVMGLLTKGGITMAQVGKMAFEALKAAIPPALIMILVERLVSMIVPAAGAVMAVVQGLMAAWGAIQKILAAIDRFIAFLKAVKSGNAGPAFANALAAAAVAVIEFVSQFLLRKIAGAASKVAGKIKAIAQKIGKKLMAAMKKVGKKIKRGATRLKDKVFGKRNKKTKTDKDGKKNQETKEDKQKKLDDAVAKIRPKIMALVAKKASSLRMKAQLLYWRVANKLSRLWVEQKGEYIGVKAQVNPVKDVVEKIFADPADLHAMLLRIGEKLKNNPQVTAEIRKIKAARARRRNNPDMKPRDAQSPAAEAAAISGKAQREPKTGEHVMMGDQDVNEGQSYTSMPGHIKTYGLGKGHYNPAITGILADMEESGLSPEVIRRGIHNVLQNKPIGPGFADHPKAASQAAAIARLMFVVEPGRNSAAFATSYMAWESAGEGGAPLKDVVTKLNPMAPKGSVADARNSLVPPEQLSDLEQDNVEALYRREMLTVVTYLESLMRAEKPMFTTDAECKVFVEKKLEKHLLSKLKALLL